MTDRDTDSWFAGVDGGGSRCRVRLTDPEGRVLTECEGGSANVYLNFDGAIATIRNTLVRAMTDAGLSETATTRVRVGLGLAGVSSHAVADQVSGALRHFESAVVKNDAVTACIGAHAGHDGGLVIAGTGSAAILRQGGHDQVIGGRGFMLGDDGSGAWIGRALLRRALRAHDGLEPATGLLQGVLDEVGGDPVRLTHWARDATSRDFGAYAPLVFQAAVRGDPAGRTIAADAAVAIGELIDRLSKLGAKRISLVGGLAGPLQPLLQPAHRTALSPPLRDSLDGALILAGLIAPHK